MNVFVYSNQDEYLTEILKFFSQQNIAVIISTALDLLLEKNFSICIFNFKNLIDYTSIFKSKSFQNNSVLVAIFSEPILDEVFDIILENPSQFELKKNLKLSLELATLREKQKQSLLVSQESLADSKFIIHRKSIYSLTTSLSQGPGFGTSVTLIDMLDQSKKEMNDSYIISKNLFDLLIKNNEYCRTLLEGLTQMTQLLENEISFDKISCNTINQEISKIIKELEPFFLEKDLKLIYNLADSTYEIYGNLEKLLLVCEELLINAIKYSQAGSQVEFTTSLDKVFTIQVKNQVHEQIVVHLPDELKQFAREPFIRFYPPGEEAIKIHKYGLGLGLTAIDYIVTQHKGEFILKEENKNSIVALINLPILR